MKFTGEDWQIKIVERDLDEAKARLALLDQNPTEIPALNISATIPALNRIVAISEAANRLYDDAYAVTRENRLLAEWPKNSAQLRAAYVREIERCSRYLAHCETITA